MLFCFEKILKLSWLGRLIRLFSFDAFIFSNFSSFYNSADMRGTFDYELSGYAYIEAYSTMNKDEPIMRDEQKQRLLK